MNDLDAQQIRYLLKNQEFSNLQLEELDLIIIRHIANYRPGQAIGETIVNYLADIEEEKPTENRPWSTYCHVCWTRISAKFQ